MWSGSIYMQLELPREKRKWVRIVFERNDFPNLMKDRNSQIQQSLKKMYFSFCHESQGLYKWYPNTVSRPGITFLAVWASSLPGGIANAPYSGDVLSKIPTKSHSHFWAESKLSILWVWQKPCTEDSQPLWWNFFFFSLIFIIVNLQFLVNFCYTA